MCARARSSLSSWRSCFLALALVLATAPAWPEDAPTLGASSPVPVTAPTSTLSSLSMSELSALWYATLDGLVARSQEDRLRLETYVQSSELAAESAMLRELALSRTVQRLSNRLTAATTAMIASERSATSSSAAFEQMAHEADRMRRSRNAWRAGAVAAGVLIIVIQVLGL